MQNNNFAETLASVASEFGVEDTAKHGRGIKPSKRPYFRWTDEQLEQLATLRDEGKSANEIAEALGVPVDRVKIKLAALKAKVPSVKLSKAEPVTPNPEPSTETVPEVSTELEAPASGPEPPTNIDCMIFMAFDWLVGLVDDYDRMANCWRQAIHIIEQHLSGCVALVREHPETEAHLCKIAAIVAYDELKA
mgnify:CR=1 FL=1